MEQIKFDTGTKIISRLDEMFFAFLETEKVKDSTLIEKFREHLSKVLPFISAKDRIHQILAGLEKEEE